jgi:DNA-binding NtrC family response regulator
VIPGDGGRQTVLIVDDNSDQRELVQRMIERAGYACVVAANGREARARLQSEPVDAAVTDVFMPDEDGLEFLRHVRESRPSLPILVVSGSGAHNPIDYLAIAMKFGATATLEKPFSSKQMATALGGLFETVESSHSGS